MNTTITTRLIYAGLAIVAYVLEHFSLIPTGTATIMLAALGGSALVSGTFTPQTKAPTVLSAPNNGISNVDVSPTTDNTRG